MRRLHPEVAVVLITGSDDRSLEGQALMRGARGYVHKSATPEQLISLLLAAADRNRPVAATAKVRLPGAGFGLTPREQQVLDALMRGLGGVEIAHELQISRATVKSHVHNLYLKLGVHNRLEAVRLLLEETVFGPIYNWL
jgi:DNA-binding NarL/FixJ family response regulator